MPKNNISVLSCSNSGNKTIIKLSMNRLVAFNAKLTGQTYSSYNGRMVVVSSVDATGLEFAFSDTDKFSGSLSFMNSNIRSAATSVSGSTAYLRLSFQNAGRFYGFHYEYNNGILTIVIKQKPSSISDYTIMIDPGHGGYDGGAGCVVSSSTWSEKKVNLAIAQKVKDYLENEGANVIMTRSSDAFLSLSGRNAMVRSYLPDLFISIHCDSSSSASAYGTSAFYYRAYSQPLAKSIHQAIVNAYKSSIYAGLDKPKIDRGASFYAYRVARVEECPAVLVEYGFVSNTAECQKLQDSSVRDTLARATVTGIKNYISNN
jgi:N-acetylmuramoyl-L-alanine amidase